MEPKKKQATRKPTKKPDAPQNHAEAVATPAVTYVALPTIQTAVTEPVMTPAVVADSNVIYEYLNPLLLVALILGWSVDYLFWDSPVGVNFAAFMSLCLLGGMIWLVSSGLTPVRSTLRL